MNAPEEFWQCVRKGTPQGCWLWTGGTNNTGYGTVWYQGRCYVAHRVAAWLSGLVPHPHAPANRKAGGFILHQCDNRLCCNPAHFKVGGYRANQLEAYARLRREPFRGETHANAKLTAAQAKIVRQRYASGERQTSIAADFGVSQAQVSKVVRRETYRNAE